MGTFMKINSAKYNYPRVLFPHLHHTKMADYDLTSKLGPFLDRHLVFPLMEFLSVKRVSVRK